MIPVLDAVSKDLHCILDNMAEFQEAYQEDIENVHPTNITCAKNLVDYLAFRCTDRTDLQLKLTQVGLSSLGRSEAAIRPQLLRVKALADRLQGLTTDLHGQLEHDPVTAGQQNLEKNATKLFGSKPEGRETRIMVTMPAEAATDVELVKNFLLAGMNVARINCAHDDPATWRKIADNIKNYRAALEIPCKIMMDLAGPKLRTGAMPEGTRVIKARPPKDSRGHVIKPGRVQFYFSETPPRISEKIVQIPINCETTGQGDLSKITLIQLTDTRNKRRKLKVIKQEGNTLLARLPAGTYFETGQTIILHAENRQILAFTGVLPPKENYLALQTGDQIKLVANECVARPARFDAEHNLLEPAVVSCGVPEALAAPDIGHKIKLDDGKFTGLVIDKSKGALLLEITEAPVGGGKLKTEKGINFPDTELPVSGLTTKDIEDLDTICDIADLIALSFVNTGDDVESLRSELSKRNSEGIGIVLKIETRRAFENLPELLLTAMRNELTGVMIARGDLGVEIGWRQMAEKQDEILWLCAAAHIPSIWATQVLESMAKTGQPTRSEITDAAMAQRAECVMLNKGPYIHKAIKMLHRIIRTMDTHQYKKSARLPKLSCKTLRMQRTSDVVI